ncbi:unnamed protein product, partial [Closterium sp. Naga37s-1]
MTIFDPSCPAAVIPPPGSPPSGCSRWKYLVFGDCVCSTRDAASLYLVSLLSLLLLLIPSSPLPLVFFPYVTPSFLPLCSLFPTTHLSFHLPVLPFPHLSPLPSPIPSSRASAGTKCLHLIPAASDPALHSNRTSFPSFLSLHILSPSALFPLSRFTSIFRFLERPTRALCSVQQKGKTVFPPLLSLIPRLLVLPTSPNPPHTVTSQLYTSTTCVLVLQHVLSACSRKRQQRRRERRGRRLATPSRNAPLLEGPLPVGTTSASAAAAGGGAPVGADDGGDDDSDDGDYIEDDYGAPNGLYHTIIDEDSASLPRTLLPLPEASGVGGGNRGEQQRDTWHQGIGGRASGRRNSGSGSGSGNSGGGGSGGGGGSSGGGKSRSIPVGMPQRQSFGQSSGSFSGSWRRLTLSSSFGASFPRNPSSPSLNAVVALITISAVFGLSSPSLHPTLPTSLHSWANTPRTTVSSSSSFPSTSSSSSSPHSSPAVVFADLNNTSAAQSSLLRPMSRKLLEALQTLDAANDMPPIKHSESTQEYSDPAPTTSTHLLLPQNLHLKPPPIPTSEPLPKHQNPSVPDSITLTPISSQGHDSTQETFFSDPDDPDYPDDPERHEELLLRAVGQFLGWAMTCIYFTGRLPPIILNCARGAVEGLAPPAFALAVAGNLAYLGSILVRSLEWKQVRPNLPWIADSASCLTMDLF